MRIALVHSFHREDVPSGENVVVRLQAEALQEAGHDVAVVARSNDDRRHRPGYRIESAAIVLTGRGADPTDELRRFGPDVVHVHNLFPNFGTRWVHRWDGPLVATVHNYRAMCAAGTLLRAGSRCVDCRTDPWAGVRHRCFQGSRLATLPLAVAGRGGAPLSPPIARADRLVAISQRAVDEYAATGVDPKRFVVVPNAVADVSVSWTPGPRWLFLGRLSAEKGLRELLAIWPQEYELDVVGDGELADELQSLPVPAGVRFLGGLDNADVRARLGGYAGLIVPSLWPEAGPPLTYVEALAAGVPSVAVAGNGAADDIDLEGTGVVISRSPDTAELTVALKEVHRDRARLGALCRSAYVSRFSTDAWVQSLLAVYADARRSREGV